MRTGLREWGRLLLQRLGDHIQNCLDRARQCKDAAAAELDDHVRSQLLNLETQWLHVAKSYEFIESLERFLVDAQKGTLLHEVEKLPKDSPED